MNKTLFSVGALLVGCLSLTACSGGGENNSEQNVGAMSGRTFRLDGPSNALGSMFIRVGDRIGSSNVCDARFSFGSVGAASSKGTVTIKSSTKGSEGWEKCDFVFHIDEAEISEEVEFKSFFAIFLSTASTNTNTDNGNNNNNNNNDDDSSSSSSAGSIGADDYVSGIEPTLVKLRFESNSNGVYTMEPTTVYLDDSEEPVQVYRIEGGFTVIN